MKKILLIIVVLLPMLSHAQFTKGDKVLGGSLSMAFQNQNSSEYETKSKGTYFSIQPRLGLLVNEKLELGGNVGYYSSSQKSESPSSTYTNEERSISAGIYARPYFALTDKFLFSLLVQSNFSRGYQITPQYDPNTGGYTDSKTKKYSIVSGVRPTFHFFPSPQWGFELGFSALGHTYEHNLSTDFVGNYFTLTYSVVNIGVSYYFRKGGE